MVGLEYLIMIQQALEQGTLLKDVIVGMIVFLHKSDPRGLLNNWRPITLLNVTYKIFVKAL